MMTPPTISGNKIFPEKWLHATVASDAQGQSVDFIPRSGENGFTLIEMLTVLAILAILTFVALPAFANDFTAEQTVVLKEIEGRMAAVKGDEAKLAQLIKQKGCVEKAADFDGLQACLSQFQIDPLLDEVKSAAHE